jgi:hypothetical protein
MSYVPDQLRQKATLFLERNELYGDVYLDFGKTLKGMLGTITLETEYDFGRMAMFCQLISKLHRYASCFNNGGHDDSLDDLSVYAMMLKHMDHVNDPNVPFVVCPHNYRDKETGDFVMNEPPSENPDRDVPISKTTGSLIDSYMKEDDENSVQRAWEL